MNQKVDELIKYGKSLKNKLIKKDKKSKSKDKKQKI